MRSTSSFTALKSGLRAALFLLLPLLLGGWSAEGDQTLRGHQSTIEVHGPVAEAQLDVFIVTLWVCGILFVLVGGVLAYATLKFKARTVADEHAEPPPQGHGNPLVEIGLIVLSIGALVVIAIPTVKNIWYTQEVPEEHKKNLMVVKASGFQWWFRFEYEGITAPQNVPTNPADKPTEANLVVGNELVVPVDTPVKVELRSGDVIHSFWLPKIVGKVDMIPNRGNYLWFIASKPGYYWGQCAEYCGEEHANMRFRAVVLSKPDWEKWLANQRSVARTPSAATAAATPPARATLTASTGHDRNFIEGDMFTAWKSMQETPKAEDAALIAKGRQAFFDNKCSGCHTIRGHSVKTPDGFDATFGGTTGPDLTHFGGRTTIAAAIRDNTPENLKQWVSHPNDVKPGNKMWYGGFRVKDGEQWVENFSVTPEEADALVAYLHSLR